MRRELLQPSLEDGLSFAIPWPKLSDDLVTEARNERLHALSFSVSILSERACSFTDESPSSARPPAPGSQPAPLPRLNVSGESEDVMG